MTTCAAMTMWTFTVAMSMGKDLADSVGPSSQELWCPPATRCSCRWYLMPTQPGVAFWLFSLLPTHMREVGKHGGKRRVSAYLLFQLMPCAKVPRLYSKAGSSYADMITIRQACNTQPHGTDWPGSVSALTEGQSLKSKLTRLSNIRHFTEISMGP